MIIVDTNLYYSNSWTNCETNSNVLSVQAEISRLGDLVISLLATGPKGRGFEPGQGD
jgi:hypothetical protein